MRKLLLFACLATMACALGCTRASDFTFLSTKNVDLGLDPSQSKGTFTGEDMRQIIVFIPLGIPDPKEAADRALEQGKGNILLNAVVYTKGWYIPLIYGQTSIMVKGDVYEMK